MKKVVPKGVIISRLYLYREKELDVEALSGFTMKEVKLALKAIE